MTRTGPLADEATVLWKTLTAMSLLGGLHCLPYAMTLPAWFYDNILNARETDKRFEYHPDAGLLFFLYKSRKLRLDRTEERY